MHDPDTFEDPEKFAPERFLRDGRLDTNARDPYDFVFGFGRRYVGLSPPADTEWRGALNSLLKVLSWTILCGRLAILIRRLGATSL